MLLLTIQADTRPTGAYEALSIELIEQVKRKKPVEKLLQTLAELNPNTLAASLDTDAKRIAFWVNVYNAHIIIQLRRQPDLYQKRSAFFKQPRIWIAGMHISFDQIEHGFLRRSQMKYGLGYIGKPFPPQLEKQFRVDTVDPRLHFVLNCGASSCPPIEVFWANQVEQQLDRRTHWYLMQHVRYEEANDTVVLTPLVSWYRGDFGGLKGVREFLKHYGMIPHYAHPKLEFETYDWELNLQNFVGERP
ncbi:MAG: DUF547 domain-containing protein [Bacteroidota bacterium]